MKIQNDDLDVKIVEKINFNLETYQNMTSLLEQDQNLKVTEGAIQTTKMSMTSLKSNKKQICFRKVSNVKVDVP